MDIVLKIVLAIGALFVFFFIIQKIRKSDIQISDSIFWIFFALSLVLLGIFPGIAFFFSELLRIDSPSNFVFLYVIAILFVKEFLSSMEIARLRSRVNELSQEVALRSFTQKSQSSENNPGEDESLPKEEE